MVNKKSYFKALKDSKKTPTTKEFPFDLLSKRMSLLYQACEILNKHPEEADSLKEVMGKYTFIEPCVMVQETIIGNIHLFYECAKKKYPHISLPSSEKSVARFRHNVLGHFQRMNNQDVVEEYEAFNKNCGFQTAWEDYLKFRDMLLSQINI